MCHYPHNCTLLYLIGHPAQKAGIDNSNPSEVPSRLVIRPQQAAVVVCPSKTTNPLSEPEAVVRRNCAHGNSEPATCLTECTLIL